MRIGAGRHRRCLGGSRLHPRAGRGALASGGRAGGGVGPVEPGRRRPGAACRRHRRQRRPRKPLDPGEGGLWQRVDQRHRGQGRRRHHDPGQRDLPHDRIRPGGEGPVPGSADDDALRQGAGRFQRGGLGRVAEQRGGDRRRRQLPGPARLHRGGGGRAGHRRLPRERRTCRTPTDALGPTARRISGSTSCCSPERWARTRR